MVNRRLFAVVPAAGLSRRMGRPKLLLPLGESTVINRLLSTLDVPQIAETVIVVRPDDDDLADQAASHRATIVRPEEAPPDMRDSVQFAIDAIQQKHSPNDDDGWMLIPADHPILEGECLAEIITAWDDCDAEILIPRYNEQRGHPTVLRWKIARESRSIPEGKGLNWLVRKYADGTQFFESNHEAVIMDLDTPEDYERLCQMERVSS